jgi:steroid delta-isomerase-like uncharacterized protein
MKQRKSHLVVIASILITPALFSCTPQADRTETNPEALVQGLADFWATKDLGMIDTLFTDDCVYEDVPDLQAYNGKQEVVQFLSDILAWAPDTRVVYEATYLGDDWATLEWVWSGTQTGDIEGLIEATGKPFSIRGSTILEFQDGKIKRNTDYYNSGRFLYQLGVKFVFPSGQVLELTE